MDAGRERVSGVLRITMSVLYGRLKVAPLLLHISDENPQLTIEIDLRDRRVSLVEEGYDPAVRSGPIGTPRGAQTLKRWFIETFALPGAGTGRLSPSR